MSFGYLEIVLRPGSRLAAWGSPSERRSGPEVDKRGVAAAVLVGSGAAGGQHAGGAPG